MASGDGSKELPTTDQLFVRIFDELISINARLNRLENPGSTSLPPAQDPTITNLPERVAQIEKTLEAIKRPRYSNKGKAPEKEAPPDEDRAIPRINMYEENDDPEQHLSTFIKAMEQGGVDKSFYVQLFFYTLGTSAQNWYSQLDPQQIQEWDHLSQLFLAHYAHNIATPATLGQLQTIKQEEGETFMAFLERWKVRTSEMIHPPSESDQVQLFIQSLQPRYQEQLNFLVLTSYEELCYIGNIIEENISQGQITEEHETSEATAQPRKFTPLGMSYAEALNRYWSIGIIELEGPTPNPPKAKRPASWDESAYCKYHQGQGHDTESCDKLKNVIQDLLEMEARQNPNCRSAIIGVALPNNSLAIENPPLASDDKLKKSYTSPTMPVKEICRKLILEGYITPIGPTPDPPRSKRSRSWDGSAFCEYHQGRGHETSSCHQLQDKIQELINNGVITAPFMRGS